MMKQNMVSGQEKKNVQFFFLMESENILVLTNRPDLVPWNYIVIPIQSVANFSFFKTEIQVPTHLILLNLRVYIATDIVFGT